MDKSQAKTFCRLLLKEIGPENVKATAEANASQAKDSIVCPSHDYCDANMVMDAAFVEAGPGSLADTDPSDDHRFDLWNVAWALARRAGFDSERV